MSWDSRGGISWGDRRHCFYKMDAYVAPGSRSWSQQPLFCALGCFSFRGPLSELGLHLRNPQDKRLRAVLLFTKGFRNEASTATQASAAVSPSNHT